MVAHESQLGEVIRIKELEVAITEAQGAVDL